MRASKLARDLVPPAREIPGMVGHGLRAGLERDRDDGPVVGHASGAAAASDRGERQGSCSLVKRIALRTAEIIISSLIIAAGVTAFEGIGLWIAMRDRD